MPRTKLSVRCFYAISSKLTARDAIAPRSYKLEFDRKSPPFLAITGISMNGSVIAFVSIAISSYNYTLIIIAPSTTSPAVHNIGRSRYQPGSDASAVGRDISKEL